MKDIASKHFSGIETEKRKSIFLLMQDWKKTVSKKEIVFKNNNEKKNHGNELFIPDGFFLDILMQKLKCYLLVENQEVMKMV
jgi:hypothetical protein